jgi:hypothetical protein
VDITADRNDEDHTGYVWTFLDARDPAQIRPGAIVIVGDEETVAAEGRLPVGPLT